MNLSNKRRGILMLTCGLVFTLTFLFGGGVVTSTNGGRSTLVFFIGLVLGMVGVGPFAYLSAKSCASCGTTAPRPATRAASFIGFVVMMLINFLSLAFFRSELFKSSFVQDLFLLGMGLGLAQFVPLGLGFLSADDERLDALKPAAPATNGPSPPVP